MGDELLHCNILKCRRVLGGSRDSCAVATSCSHVFCLDCSNTHFHPDVSRRACPACKTALPNPEEVYVQNLSVSFESRSVFLAALQPALILDMTAKAINFFTYQMTQEAAFQRLLLKKAQDRANNFSKQYESVVREASAEITTANDKITSLESELEQLKMRNRELKQQQREAHAGYSKLKAQMDQMKHRKGPSSAHSAEEVAETLLEEFRLDDQLFSKPHHRQASGPQSFKPAQPHAGQQWTSFASRSHEEGLPALEEHHQIGRHFAPGAAGKAGGHVPSTPSSSRAPTPRLPGSSSRNQSFRQGERSFAPAGTSMGKSHPRTFAAYTA